MRKSLPIKNISKLPKTTGVYFLKNKKGEIFYIGKANNIRTRVQSHARENLPSSVHHLLSEIKKVEYIITANEIEALIKESEFIKKHDPKMNYRLRDDKKYFFVGITTEDLPHIFITHQPIATAESKVKNQKSKIEKPSTSVANKSTEPTNQNYKLQAKNYNLKPITYLGPFTDGDALKQTMKYLRRTFPYYTANSKKPISSPKHKSLPCSWCHLRLCPGPHPDKKEYVKNILRIKNILQGRHGLVISSIKRDMEVASKKQNYEKAKQLRDIIQALENIFMHYHIPPNPVSALPTGSTSRHLNIYKYLTKLFKSDLPIKTIEGYDISNIQGREATGSMVRFDNGVPNKSLYRKFNIQSPALPNDYRMMQEIIERRYSHTEWKYPDMILIDGGRGQLNAALKIIQNIKLTIPIASLAKRDEELYLPNRQPKKLSTMPKEVENLLKSVRDEAHRFAITHHRKKHSEKFKK